MDETITFTIALKVYEIIAYAFLGGAVFCVTMGLICYRFDFKRLIKDKL